MATTPVPPVLPADFCEVVPKAGEKVCTQVGKSLIQFPLLVCRFFSWAMNPDGTPSDDFKLWVGTITPSQDMPAPTNVFASDEFPDKVEVTWSGNTLARTYEIWRGTSSNPLDSTWAKLGDKTSTPYIDITGTPGQVYYYAVKASDGTKVSGFSNTDDGLKKTGTDPTPGVSDTYIFTDPSKVHEATVPAGKVAMTVWLWAGGGNGGRSEHDGFVSPGSNPPPCPPGGGGASGAFAKITDFGPVVGGEIWVVGIGAAGGSSVISKKGEEDTKYVRVYAGGNGTRGSTFNTGSPGNPANPGGLFTLTSTVVSLGTAGSGPTGGVVHAETIDGTEYSAGKGGDGGQPTIFVPPPGTPGQPGGFGLAYVKFT